MPRIAQKSQRCLHLDIQSVRRPAQRQPFSCSGGRGLDVPTAPKKFPDIKSIRASPKLYGDNCVLRNYNSHSETPEKINALAVEAGALQNALREPRSRIKQLERQLANSRADKETPEKAESGILEQIKRIKKDVEDIELRKTSCEEEAHSLALSLPNLTSPLTPTNGNPKVISYINYDEKNSPQYSKSADHSEIGRKLSLLDFTSASTTTGWGFYYLLNEAALLEQALVQYALSVALRHGWSVVSPPSLVYSHIADACGFQPRDQNDEQQIWSIAQSGKEVGKPKRSLAATAEIPLASLQASKSIPESALPLKYVGSSRCYRAEAGARGVDTRGLYRVHEFTKVEMFAWTDSPSPAAAPASSTNPTSLPDWTAFSTTVFDEMLAIQTEILSSLGLPCRVLEMPSSDLGASAYRKIDIEALFPSRMSRDEGWGEVTSASICTDYQSRRLDTRVLDGKGSTKRFPHTVNGTAVAIPRVLAAILEHGWREAEGVVVVPDVLRPYLNGLEKICAK